MLSSQGCKNRRDRLWQALPPEIEWVFVADPRHVNYLSGFWVNPLSLSSGERAFLYLRRGGESILVCDNHAFASAIGHPYVDDLMVESWYDHRHAVTNRDHVLFAALKRIKDKLLNTQGLIESEWVPVGALADICEITAIAGTALPSLGSVLRGLRRIKDQDEIAILKRCIDAGEAGQLRGKKIIRPGISELDLYREVQSTAIERLGEQALVYGDFRATSPTHPRTGGPPTTYVLREGDAFILDFSVVFAGYRSDFTNTLAVGTPTQGQRELMELCKIALVSGEMTLKSGNTGAKIFQSVAGSFESAGRSLSHHAGHGIGLGHPEAPSFVPESDEVLATGEVVTLEPGVYVEGIGGVRIEHNYLITDNGAERLTNHATEL